MVSISRFLNSLRLMRASALLKFQNTKTLLENTHITERTLTDADVQKAIAIGDEIRRAAENSYWPVLCLPQAIAVRKMLHKHNIPNRIIFGYLPKSKREDRARLDIESILPKEVFDNSNSTALITKMAGRNAHVWVNVQRGQNSPPITVIGGEVSHEYSEIAAFD